MSAQLLHHVPGLDCSCDCRGRRRHLRSRLRSYTAQSRPRPSDGHSLVAEPGSTPHQRCGVGADDRADGCGIAWGAVSGTQTREESRRVMDEDDPRGPGADERPGKTDQQIFDEQVARGTGTLVLIVAGVGIVAALGDVDHRPGQQHERKPHDDRHRARQDLGRNEHRPPEAAAAHRRRARQASLRLRRPQRQRDRLRVVSHDESGGHHRDDRTQPRQGAERRIPPRQRASRPSTPTRRKSSLATAPTPCRRTTEPR